MPISQRRVVRPPVSTGPNRFDPSAELDDPRVLAKQQKVSTPPPKSVVPAAAPLPATARLEKLLYAQLLANPILTGFGQPIVKDGSALLDGDGAGVNKYRHFYQNAAKHRIAIKIVVDFATPGGRVRFSLADDESDRFRIAELALSGVPPQGVESDWFTVGVNESVYINNGLQADGSIAPLSALDRFRIFEADPQVLMLP